MDWIERLNEAIRYTEKRHSQRYAVSRNISILFY